MRTLKTFRKVRDVVGEIHLSAAAVDEHLGRFQLYGEEGEIGQTKAETEHVFAKVQRLETELRRCTEIPDHQRNPAKQRGATDHREASPAGLV